MKCLKRFSLATLLALTSILTASAADFEVDGIYYNVLSMNDLTCEVTYGGTKYSGNISIPSSVSHDGKTYTVKSIGDSAFADCFDLLSAVIPNSVTSIEDYAFDSCFNLASVQIPRSVTLIGWYAFMHCRSLTSVVIPEQVTWIGEYVFCDCFNLTSVIIPDSVKAIGKRAFSGCTKLLDVTSLSNTPPSLDADVFASETKASGVLRVPKKMVKAYSKADGWKLFNAIANTNANNN